jgi:hypothetical protein
MAATYRFKTIMVTDSDREDLTNFRDSLKSEEYGRVTDKELFSAIWDLINKEELKSSILQDKKIKKDLKERQKLEALKKELESKLEEVEEVEKAEQAA